MRPFEVVFAIETKAGLNILQLNSASIFSLGRVVGCCKHSQFCWVRFKVVEGVLGQKKSRYRSSKEGEKKTAMQASQRKKKRVAVQATSLHRLPQILEC